MVYDTNTLDNASENLQPRHSKVTAKPSLGLNTFRRVLGDQIRAGSGSYTVSDRQSTEYS
jgi:hypothetical protein